ncbi:MAG: ParA family protein [Gammaproteobacteria bacterium]
MKTWVVANQKGGVGKTTTAITLAGILAQQGQRVLMVDFDPHASMSQYFGFQIDDLEVSVYDIFDSEADTEYFANKGILQTSQDNLFLAPANIALATLDKKFGQQRGLGLKLKQFLAIVEHEYDYVVVDCPPMLGVLMINALVAADQLIIPVQTEFLAIKGLERMLSSADMVYKRHRQPPQICIVPTLFDKRTRASVDSLRHLRTHYEDMAWRSVISIDTKFRNASQAHIIPSAFMPDSRGVEEYMQLCRDLQKGTINRFTKIMEAV